MADNPIFLQPGDAPSLNHLLVEAGANALVKAAEDLPNRIHLDFGDEDLVQGYLRHCAATLRGVRDGKCFVTP